jgi:hypothetical protein
MPAIYTYVIRVRGPRGKTRPRELSQLNDIEGKTQQGQHGNKPKQIDCEGTLGGRWPLDPAKDLGNARLQNPRMPYRPQGGGLPPFGSMRPRPRPAPSPLPSTLTIPALPPPDPPAFVGCLDPRRGANRRTRGGSGGGEPGKGRGGSVGEGGGQGGRRRGGDGNLKVGTPKPGGDGQVNGS